MAYQAVITAYTFSMIIALLILIVAIQKRQAPKSLYFAYMSFAIFLYTLGYLLEITSKSMEAAILGVQVQYFGIPFIAPLLLLFILEFCDMPVKRWFVVLSLVLPVLTSILAISWPWNGIYYNAFVFLKDVVVPHVVVRGGTFYYVFFIYIYVMSLSAITIAVLQYKKGDGIFKRQARILIIASVIPLLGNLSTLLSISPYQMDITPILLSVTCMLLGYSFLNLGLFQLAPIARAQIIETMSDGFVLLDMQGRFIEANAAAKKLMPQLAACSVGAYMRQIEGLPWSYTDEDNQQKEFYIVDPSGVHRYYRTSETVIHYNNKAICNCIMIYDTTETKRLLDEMSELAEHDALTGLINRGTFFKIAELMLDQLAANGSHASILMMDLDHFKRVNDSYGHLAGDEVLRKVAQTVTARFRSSDLFARYGGEEFCAFLPEAEAKDVLDIAEQIRKTVEHLVFTNDQGNFAFTVTISIGIAFYDTGRHCSLETLISEADEALYTAKKQGRNRIVSNRKN